MTLPFKRPLERPKGVRIAPLLWRRTWVLLSLLGYGLAFGGVALEQARAVWLGLGVLMVGAAASALAVSNLFDLGERLLDERLRGARDAIYRRAYRTMMVLVSVYISALFWWPHLPALSGFYQTVLMLEGFFFFLGLPTLMLAWLESEEPRPEVPRPDPLE